MVEANQTWNEHERDSLCLDRHYDENRPTCSWSLAVKYVKYDLWPICGDRRALSDGDEERIVRDLT